MHQAEQCREVTLADRLGSCALGLLVGMAAGLLIALLVSAFGVASGNVLAVCVFGMGAAVAILGYLAPNSAFVSFTGLAHLSWGLLNGLSEHWPGTEPGTPWWLKALVVVGVAVGLLCWVWWWYL